jgi:hypothetical protein
MKTPCTNICRYEDIDGEPIKEKDKRRWCSVECRDEQERYS